LVNAEEEIATQTGQTQPLTKVKIEDSFVCIYRPISTIMLRRKAIRCLCLEW
jgi:hypothetical protein